MRIEIVHWRDPDHYCERVVFIDGVEVPFEVYDVDPGRGWTRLEWDQQTEYQVSQASPNVAAYLRQARDDAADNSEDITDEHS